MRRDAAAADAAATPRQEPSALARPPAAGAIIEIRALRHEIGGRLILALPEWSVRAGQHSLIRGPSGSGKTTLLHLIAGLLRPTAGSVTVAGQELGALGPAAVDAFRGRHVGIVFQTLHLVSALTVAGNLRLARNLAGLPPDEDRILHVLRSLGVRERADARPRDLSQGEAQRVAIARAVINGPTLILADEPTSALDDRSAATVLDLLLEQAAACGATVVIGTHDGRVQERFARRLDLPERS
jgi:putative ABC transport system ATP-binding protein